MQTATKMCSECKQSYTLPHFKRLLTRAQTKARGYVGRFRVEIESKLCQYCQPRPKPLKELTARQLRNLVASGDLNIFIANSIIDERKKSSKALKKGRAQEQWEKGYQETWRALITDLNKEIEKVKQQKKYAKANDAKLNAYISHATHYAMTYQDILTRLRARLWMECRKPRNAPHSVRWVDHLDWREKEKVHTVWSEIPYRVRERMKLPLVLTMRGEDPEAVKPKYKLRKTDRATPKERLSDAAPLPQGGEAPRINTPQPPAPTAPVDWDNL